MEDGTFKLRDYQADIVDQAKSILRQKGLVYLAMEVRTGKTFCALFTCEGATDVLFVTKKKAIHSIENDFKTSGLTYNLKVINYESLHKIEPRGWSVIIVDESHSLGAFPKPSKRAKQLKEFVVASKCPTIHLSGTPTPESYSQIFHQFYINPNTPFKEKSFYKWAGNQENPNHVNVRKKRVGLNMIVNDYSGAIASKIKPVIRPFMIHYSQEDAGFTSAITEEILKVKMNDTTYDLASKLTKDLVVVGKEQTLIADTPVKLQSKLHQIYSGTIKFEDGTRRVLDLSKANYIRDRFIGKKLAIFYKFTAEYLAIKEVFGDLLVNDISEFDERAESHIALQIQSGREGTKLSNADCLLFYNIDFSATSYWQGRDRMTTMDRKFNNVYWIFSEGGIEEKIYDMVTKKKSYTSYYFRRDYGIKDSKRFKQINLDI